MSHLQRKQAFQGIGAILASDSAASKVLLVMLKEPDFAHVLKLVVSILEFLQ